jgi:type I restriction enzyme, S subunit
MYGVKMPRLGTQDAVMSIHQLPPLNEQRRIVAKIDRLMAQCDELENLGSDRNQKRITIHTAAIDRLLAAQEDSDFSTAWDFIQQHFGELYSVKENVAELRKAILQLAVMGKLVPQDPNDEPASELLNKLRQSRLSVYKSEKHKNNPETKTMLRKLNNLGSVIAPFELPKSWVTVHLIDCCEYLVDCHNKTAPYKESGIPIIRTTNVRDRQICMPGMKYVDEGTYDFWARRCPPQSGDIIFTREAPMGEAAIIPEGMVCCLGQRTMLIRSMHQFINIKYLLIALTEPRLLERASTSAIGSTVKHLRVGDVEELNIPLPPFAEQKRIVVKIDQLMELCDRLEQQIDAATKKRTELLNALTTQV